MNFGGKIYIKFIPMHHKILIMHLSKLETKKCKITFVQKVEKRHTIYATSASEGLKRICQSNIT